MDKERYTAALVDALYDADVEVDWSRDWNPNYFQISGKSQNGKRMSCWCDVDSHKAKITLHEQECGEKGIAHYLIDLADPESISKIIKIFQKAKGMLAEQSKIKKGNSTNRTRMPTSYRK